MPHHYHLQASCQSVGTKKENSPSAPKYDIRSSSRGISVFIFHKAAVLQAGTVHDLVVDGEFTAFVFDDKDAETATAAVEGVEEALAEIALVDHT